jgi:hypothetical protein
MAVCHFPSDPDKCEIDALFLEVHTGHRVRLSEHYIAVLGSNLWRVEEGVCPVKSEFWVLLWEIF